MIRPSCLRAHTESFISNKLQSGIGGKSVVYNALPHWLERSELGYTVGVVSRAVEDRYFAVPKKVKQTVAVRSCFGVLRYALD
jgi:hypothetical protein